MPPNLMEPPPPPNGCVRCDRCGAVYSPRGWVNGFYEAGSSGRFVMLSPNTCAPSVGSPARRAPTGRVVRVNRFDRFAEYVDRRISKAAFFSACVVFVLLWAVSGPTMGFSDTWQLIINTSTTVVTFLMVALLENTVRRFEVAVLAYLKAILTCVAALCDDAGHPATAKRARETIGIEDRTSA